MSDTTDIIRRPAGETFVIIRESYLAITSGDKSAAILLSWAEQWYKYKLKARAQARALNTVKKGHGEAADQDEGLWIYRSTTEIANDDLLGSLSDKTVGKKMELLEELGFIRRRHNPHQPYDRKLQYLFVRAKVQEAVDTWAAARAKPDIDPDQEEQQEGQGGQEEEKTAPGSHSEKVPDGEGTGEEAHSEKVPNEDRTYGNTIGNFFRMYKEIPSIASFSASEEEASASPASQPPASLNAAAERFEEEDQELEALLDQAEGGQPEGISDHPQAEATPPLPDHSDSTIGDGGKQVPQTTDREEVPAASGGAAAAEEAVNAQLNKYLNKKWLAPYPMGDTTMPPLIEEMVGGLDRHEIARVVSLDTVRELHNQTRRNMRARTHEQATNSSLPGLNYTTELLRLLHEHVEQRLVVRELAEQYHISRDQAEPSGGHSGETAGKLRVSGLSEWQVGDEVIYQREPHKIVAITALKITVGLLSDVDIQSDIIRSAMTPSTLRPYLHPARQTG